MAGSPDNLESMTKSLWDPSVAATAQADPMPAPSIPDQDSSDSPSSHENRFFEHHGPKSFLSICSDRAVRWLRARVVAADEQLVVETVNRLAVDSDRKFNDMMPAVQTPEPDPQTAWELSQEYFNHRADTFFGVVTREDFENRLRRHFDPALAVDPDPSWFALRNTIYGLGTRLLLSKRGYDPKVIHAHAWRYFENALSVHSRVLFSSHNDLTGVQALALMSFFAENILSSRVEYMLCSTAVRLAQALGLNHEQTQLKKLGPSEISHRSRIWWALYCYDKLISMRDGRPSCIDDDDVSCPLPRPGPNDNIDKFEAFIITIKHAQISSTIYKRLLSASASRQGEDDQKRTIRAELERDLHQWRDSLPLYLRPGTLFKPSTIPPGVHIDNVVYSHYAYYGSIIAIYNQFPWSTPFDTSEQTPFPQQYALECREKVMNAAKNIILATKYHDIDLNTTGCLVFAYPMTAVNVLFVHMLQDPLALSTQSAAVLLDVAAGHFAKLELATSMQLEVQFVRDIANIVRRKIEEAQANFWTDVSFPEIELTAFPDTRFLHGLTNENLNFMEFSSDDVPTT